jgi:asparagine synthase (glutamine-hydrolysing)
MVASHEKETLLKSRDGRLILAYNGEVYNHGALRLCLPKGLRESLSPNDGAIILGLYEQRGDLSFLSELEGMFAFALWDREKKKLLLARDKLGIKPLYIQREGSVIRFASELRALACTSEARIDARAIADFCLWRFIPAPRTPFLGIRKLEPANWIVYDETGNVSSGCYWRAVFGGKNHESIPLGLSFDQAVESTSRSDHEFGVWLSGGLDSSAIAASMARHQPHLNSFSVGYAEAGIEDERAEAAEVAAHVGAAHHSCQIEPLEVLDLIRQVAYASDEPLYTSVGISTFELSRLSSTHLRGVLTGDGSDELFMGYGYLKGVFDCWQDGGNWEQKYVEQVGWLPERIAREVFAPLTDLQKLPTKDNLHPMDRIRNFELNLRLPDYHLTRVDRLSMAHSLEARVPYLRDSVVSWATSQPWEELFNANPPKQILRSIFSSHLPKSVLIRPKKPFTSPSEGWLRGPLRQLLQAVLLDKQTCQDLGFNARALERLLAQFTAGQISWRSIWGFFVLFQWYVEVFERRRQNNKTSKADKRHDVIRKII